MPIAPGLRQVRSVRADVRGLSIAGVAERANINDRPDSGGSGVAGTVPRADRYRHLTIDERGQIIDPQDMRQAHQGWYGYPALAKLDPLEPICRIANQARQNGTAHPAPHPADAGCAHPLWPSLANPPCTPFSPGVDHQSLTSA